MIINQTINNGFLTVNKTGAYFSLISAGGVVNVRLSEKGRVVLDTKMWVGMSIDKAIPFDEITIQGDDGAVTFWAGDTSISGQANVSIKGATAVRTKTVDVLGSKLITLSDLTRQAIRLRTNKEVFLGGSGVDGTGWRLPVGVVEELPIAGSLYAYKKLPELKLQDAKILNEYAKPQGLESKETKQGTFHVSKDGLTILFGSTSNINEFRISNDAGDNWEVPSWVGVIGSQTNSAFYLVRNLAKNEIYLISKFTSYIKIFLSKNDGVSFDHLFTASSVDLVGQTLSTVGYPYGHMVSGKLFFSVGEWWGLLDLEKLKVISANKWSDFYQNIKKVFPEIQGNQLYNARITSSDGKRIIGATSSPEKTFASSDGGETWEIVSDKFLTIYTDDSGENVCGKSIYGGYYPYFSNDGGLTFKKYSDAGQVSNKQIVNFYNDIWIEIKSNTLLAFYIVNGEYKHAQAGLDGLMQKSGYIFTESANLITGQGSAAGEEMQRVELSVNGDLSPALVEVMELLN